MANVLAFLHRFDADQPDGLLLALAGAPEVEETSITTRNVPRPGHHGVHAVTWRQDGRTRTVEGSTLAVALRAAVRAASPRSATSTTDPTPDRSRSVFRTDTT